jgi:hypothetical protein
VALIRAIPKNPVGKEPGTCDCDGASRMRPSSEDHCLGLLKPRLLSLRGSCSHNEVTVDEPDNLALNPASGDGVLVGQGLARLIGERTASLDQLGCTEKETQMSLLLA